jgi:hypothetical protein
MRRSRRERGEGQFGCIIGLIVLAVVGYIAFKVIPIKVKSAELRQEIVDQARSAGNRSEGKIRYNIMKKAEELNLPLADKDLKIQQSSERIRISAEYTVPVEFPGYTWMWKYSHRAENPLF